MLNQDLNICFKRTLDMWQFYYSQTINSQQKLKLKNKITVLIKTQRQRSGRSKTVRSCRATELSGLGYFSYEDFLMGYLNEIYLNKIV
ncbi:hypothetical protein BpHYR1_000169 [Brachionus plicatilis]|uniref:Uncharacterized protein n=1 Tax=Brachionus plicatilis TaxID=10195 RepID=A0A3M7SEY0_BRAPC|nr:hypothetical protein BpHYR1_000169 [Brachionus plicatilis]